MPTARTEAICPHCDYSLWGHSLALPDFRVGKQIEVLRAGLDGDDAVKNVVARLQRECGAHFDRFRDRLQAAGVADDSDEFLYRLQVYVLCDAPISTNCPECGIRVSIPDPDTVQPPPGAEEFK